jgi:hypothetical protein
MKLPDLDSHAQFLEFLSKSLLKSSETYSIFNENNIAEFIFSLIVKFESITSDAYMESLGLF